MNLRMWLHPATRRNVASLIADGALFVGPDEGEMACGEYGPGRMAEPPAILAAIEDALSRPTALALPAKFRADAPPTLAGKHVVVTSGPTHEPIDPVRYIANRSSGRQGHAIAQVALGAGARVTLITGPTRVENPIGADVVRVVTALQMRDAALKALPADIFIAAAAVADWRVESPSAQKLKKGSQKTASLSLVENPDILAEIGNRVVGRPKIVAGFAAETENMLANARQKLASKGCDLIIANDVSPAAGVFGGEDNQVTLVCTDGVVALPRLKKSETAKRIVDHLTIMLGKRA